MELNLHPHLDPNSIELKVLLMVAKLLLALALPLHLKDMKLALLALRVGLYLDLVKPLLLFQMLVVNQRTMLQ
jgi:hypothetical protein